MSDFLLAHYSSIRLASFVCVLLIMAFWEFCRPQKRLTQAKLVRWLNNVSIVALNGVLLPLTLPVLAFGIAIFAHTQQFGLIHVLLTPAQQQQFAPLLLILSVLFLDLVIYWQHRLFHQIPILWRLHRVHHSDQDIDVTTGSRFHFIEIWLSMLIKIAMILAFGISPIAVLIFEVTLNACAMFNHSNIKLPTKVDQTIRVFLVTPDMHRVHHSIHRNETDSNYGFCLSIWDRWFKTYIPQPKDGHQNMKIGISLFRHPSEQKIWNMLTQPFREK
ncbi:MAG: sterol desaturase family protein [Vibrio sp.]